MRRRDPGSNILFDIRLLEMPRSDLGLAQRNLIGESSMLHASNCGNYCLKLISEDNERPADRNI